MQFILQADQFHHLVGTTAHIGLIFPARGLHYKIEVLEDITVVQQLIILKYNTDLAAQVWYILTA